MGKLWILLLIFCTSSWAIKDNFSAVDKLRHDLMLLQNLPIHSRSGRDDNNDVYFKVFEIYDKFSEKMTNEHLNTGKRHLNSLNSLRLWALVQKDMNIIEGMYSNYLQKLHAVTQTFEPINIEYWNNFADVVFTHPNVSISAALERISDVIIQQNLFIDAYKVFCQLIYQLMPI